MSIEQLTQEDVVQAVEEGLENSKAMIVDEARELISDEFGQKLGAVQSDVSKLQGSLDELQKGGAAFNSEKVADFEVKLAEASNKQKDLEERVRLLQARPIASAAVTAETRDAELFKHYLFSNIAEVKKRVRQAAMLGEETRAIDSSLFASGGKLSPETADRFIEFVTNQQVALSRVTVRRLNSPQGYTDVLTVSARSTRLAVEGTPPTAADGVGTTRRTMTTVEKIWPEDLTLTFLEDNIERQGAQAHIAQLIALAFGNDVEDLAWNGDASASDDFLKINNGWIVLALADSDVHDVASFASAIDTAHEVFQSMLQAMPYKFLARTDLSYWVPVKLAQVYADELSARQTALGDDVMVNGFPVLRYFGRPVYPIVYLTSDEAMLTPASNLHYGVQRLITNESEWKPRSRVVELTITVRDDYEYATGDAIVLADNLPTALV